MKAIIQRVNYSKLKVNGEIYSEIEKGLMILLGITHDDTVDDIKWLSNKIVNLRIFNDDNGKMNKNIMQIKGEVLVVSQFTLYADTNKGNRPSFINAAKPELAILLYNHFIDELQKLIKIGHQSFKVKVGGLSIEEDAKRLEIIRQEIGAVAYFRQAAIVAQLPKTRSGKILRKTIRQTEFLNGLRRGGKSCEWPHWEGGQ